MKKLVVTLCIGESFEPLGRITHPTMKAYADRIGADFVVITQGKIPAMVQNACTICYEKHQIRHFLKDYDRVIYLDSDIIVKSTCPSLFDLVPLGWFGAFSEGSWWERKDALVLGRDQFGFDAVFWEKRYFNAGVMVCDRSHSEIFRLPIVGHSNFYDQTWFNIQVAQQAPERFIDIGPHFNRMSSLRWGDRFESFIIHYAGSPRDPHAVLSDIQTWEGR